MRSLDFVPMSQEIEESAGSQIVNSLGICPAQSYSVLGVNAL